MKRKQREKNRKEGGNIRGKRQAEINEDRMRGMKKKRE